MASKHTFVWHDIMTTDPVAAAAYYERVVGWSSADSGVPGASYTLFSAGSIPVGGLMQISKEAAAAGAKPRWMGYVGVDDVDRAAEKLRAAGGVIHRAPEDIPSVGRFAYVADPQGASFFLFSSHSEAPTAVLGTPGHVGWNELYAGNGAEAFDWYAGQYGWTKDRAIDMGSMGVYQTFSTRSDAAAIGGIMTKMPHQSIPYWLFYFNVEAIDAAAARATEAGGEVFHGPSEVPGGLWIVQCTDPQGAQFAMVAPKASAEPPTSGCAPVERAQMTVQHVSPEAHDQ